MTTHSRVVLALIAVGAIACTGCQSASTAMASAATTTPGASEKPAAHRGPEVEIVRNGVLTGFDSTTVGKAFEGTFQNATWSSFETPKGATVVQFDGTVNRAVLNDLTRVDQFLRPEAFLRDRCIDFLGLDQQQKTESDEAKIRSCVETRPLPVRFQFLLSADKTSFQISHLDPLFREKTMAFIFQ